MTKMTTMIPRKAAIAPITAGKGNWAVSSDEAAVVPIYKKGVKPRIMSLLFLLM